MSPWKRWMTMAAATMFVGLTLQTALSAQEPTLPKDGKALASQLGLSQDEATKLMPDLNQLATALTRHEQMLQQAEAVRTELHEALTKVAPTLTPEQRQSLMGMMGRGSGMGSGMGYGMRGGMRGSMGPGMRGSMGPGMHRGMHRGMHQGMGPGMHQGMGPGMHQGMGPANCPYYKAQPQGADSTGSGGAPQGR
jgi:hypothetical protein